MLLQFNRTEDKYIKKNCLTLFWIFSLPIMALNFTTVWVIPILYKIIIVAGYLFFMIGTSIYIWRLLDPNNTAKNILPEWSNIQPLKRTAIFNNYLFSMIASVFPQNVLGSFKIPFVYYISAYTGILIMISLIIYFGNFSKVNQRTITTDIAMNDSKTLTIFVYLFLFILAIITALLINNSLPK